jgi:hypothetical protein
MIRRIPEGNSMKSKRTLAVLAAALCLFAADACKKKKDAASLKPASPAAGTVRPAKPAGSDQEQQPSNACADVPADTILCTCVPGGFDVGGTAWDYDCCVGPEEWLYSCGDSQTCDPATFECVDL